MVNLRLVAEEVEEEIEEVVEVVEEEGDIIEKNTHIGSLYLMKVPQPL